jgi:hypothetical protein
VSCLPSFWIAVSFKYVCLFRSSNHILIAMHSETCREAGQNTQLCHFILQWRNSPYRALDHLHVGIHTAHAFKVDTNCTVTACRHSVSWQCGRVDGRLGSRLRGYHPVAPPFSSARHLQRHSMSRDMRDLCYWRTELGREMAGQFGLWFRLLRKSHVFYMPQICDMGQAALLPLREIRRLRPGSNSRS